MVATFLKMHGAQIAAAFRLGASAPLGTPEDIASVAMAHCCWCRAQVRHQPVSYAVYVDTFPCKIPSVYVWRILQRWVSSVQLESECKNDSAGVETARAALEAGQKN